MRASGTFEVQLKPIAAYDDTPGSPLGRMSIDKQFAGDIEGTSKGEMLMAGTAVKGSAGYVAIERVQGSIHGKAGSWVFQHSGTMDRGAPQLVVTVVPDSGSGELTGLTGACTIRIEGGKHFYEMSYAINEDNVAGTTAREAP